MVALEWVCAACGLCHFDLHLDLRLLRTGKRIIVLTRKVRRKLKSTFNTLSPSTLIFTISQASTSAQSSLFHLSLHLPSAHNFCLSFMVDGFFREVGAFL